MYLHIYVPAYLAPLVNDCAIDALRAIDQRVMVAAQWSDTLRELAKERQKASRFDHGKNPKSNTVKVNPPSPQNRNVTRTAVAKRAQVSP